MRHASCMECGFFDPSSVFEDVLVAPEEHIGRCHIAEALVISGVVVGVHKGLDLGLQITGEIVVFQQHPVLQSLMPPFDLSLGLRVVGRTSDVFDAPVTEPFGQISCDI